MKFEHAARARLLELLPERHVDELERRVAVAQGFMEQERAQPGNAEVRAQLKRMSELAGKLRVALDPLGPESVRIDAHLKAIFHQHMDRPRAQMTADLECLAEACRRVAGSLATQTQRQSHVLLVSKVAALAKDAGLDVSEAPRSRFFTICRLVFEAVGVFQSPAASIRAYKTWESSGR